VQTWAQSVALSVLALLLALQAVSMAGGDDGGRDVELPEGVEAVWDLDKAYREGTATRERICINGLWRFMPVGADEEPVPPAGSGWGYFKVPGRWPQGDGHQLIYAPEAWRERVPELDAAWQMREIVVPSEWRGRRIGLRVEWLNSYAKVFVDGVEVGSLIFPGGELDITRACTPGKVQTLALQVFARRLSRDWTSLRPPGERSWWGGRVMANRGLLGDVYLTSAPTTERISHVKAETSVRKKELTVGATLEGVQAGTSYRLQARVLEAGEEVLQAHSAAFSARDLDEGRISFAASWPNPKLWDLDTPENKYELAVELVEGERRLDAYYPVRFGFREFWIEGADLFLNGSPVHLRVVPVDSAWALGAANSCYEGARETFERQKMFGFNAVYTHNYGCRPGDHSDFSGVLQAADDMGMLLCFSLPHTTAYDWSSEDGVAAYKRHLAWYVGHAQNHPSVIMYSQNHNTFHWNDDQNPLHLGELSREGLSDQMRQRLEETCERQLTLKEFDTAHPVYNHHGPGRQLSTLNCYLNWVPMQERSDWWRWWREREARPLVLMEYGEPLYFSYSSIRGSWYLWESANLHQWFWTEYGATVRGDAAYELSEFEKAGLRWEAEKWRNRQPFNQKDYPTEMDFLTNIPNIRGLQAEYIAQTWPYIRTIGLSGFNIWHDLNLCYPAGELPSEPRVCDVDWENLQRPGVSPDQATLFPHWGRPGGGMPYALATDRDDWVPSVRGEAILRYNQPLLAYIGGPRKHFSARGHNVHPGDVVEKQAIVLNDSRRPVECECRWSVSLPGGITGQGTVEVAPGENGRLPIRFRVPESAAPGAYEISLTATFSTGEAQQDTFSIDVMEPQPTRVEGRVAVYDPKGETAGLLSEMGIDFGRIGADTDLGAYDVVVIGKGALSAEGPAPDLSGVPDGLKVVVFEQSFEAVEKRLGFRAQEYGLRRAFTRVPGHPLLEGITDANLHDWQGEATLLPETMDWDQPHSYPMVEWCGFEVPRPGRAGRWGNVSSVMIEKPSTGDFLPLVVGGFALQYSPLMVYREGEGTIVFCQMDVTGRTEQDPAALRLVGNIMRWADEYRAEDSRGVVYAGEPEGLAHLRRAGVKVRAYDGGRLGTDDILVAGPGSGERLSADAAAIRSWLNAGGRFVGVGLSQQEPLDWLPVALRTEEREHMASFFAAPCAGSPLAGIGCADLMTRDAGHRPMVVGGATALGDGALATAMNGRAVFLQLVPWRFDYVDSYNVKMALQHTSLALNRALANLGASFETPLLENWMEPLEPGEAPDERLLRSPWIQVGGRLQLLPGEWKGMPLLARQEPPAGWQQPGYDDASWREVMVPGSWESQFEDLREHDGGFLYRVALDVPADMVGGKAVLVLGPIADEDHTSVNGEPVGSITMQTHGWRANEAERRYELRPGLLKAGENVLAVQVTNRRREGGILGFEKAQFAVKEAFYGERMRWVNGLYLDKPVEEDDPYRYFRW
jgi:beta-galactosidase